MHFAFLSKISSSCVSERWKQLSVAGFFGFSCVEVAKCNCSVLSAHRRTLVCVSLRVVVSSCLIIEGNNKNINENIEFLHNELDPRSQVAIFDSGSARRRAADLSVEGFLLEFFCGCCVMLSSRLMTIENHFLKRDVM